VLVTGGKKIIGYAARLHQPLPHRLARWGAKIIGYAARLHQPLPHRLARWGAKIIGYEVICIRRSSSSPIAHPVNPVSNTQRLCWADRFVLRQDEQDQRYRSQIVCDGERLLFLERNSRSTG
jgi:hypothetical protein